MDGLEYPACIRELYESEIFGEAAALALVTAATNDRDRYHFGTLLQLETETKARLRPFLFAHGMDLAEEMDLGDLDAMVADYLSNGFHAFARGTRPLIEKTIALFREIARIGPPEDQEVLDSMVRHESSILKWLEMESEGEAEGSLDDVIDQLQHPLPRPSNA